MTAAQVAKAMTAAGFSVRLWRDTRIYVHGYGCDITASIEPLEGATLDAARIDIKTSWRSPHATLRCKGVKHALLVDLFDAGLLAAPPPDHWRQVRVEDRPRIKRITLTTSSIVETMPWPFDG